MPEEDVRQLWQSVASWLKNLRDNHRNGFDPEYKLKIEIVGNSIEVRSDLPLDDFCRNLILFARLARESVFGIFNGVKTNCPCYGDVNPLFLRNFYADALVRKQLQEKTNETTAIQEVP